MPYFYWQLAPWMALWLSWLAERMTELVWRAGKNSFGGLGATMVDALDTLWLMGLTEEFQRARDWVVHELSFDR